MSILNIKNLVIIYYEFRFPNISFSGKVMNLVKRGRFLAYIKDRKLNTNILESIPGLTLPVPAFDK